MTSRTRNQETNHLYLTIHPFNDLTKPSLVGWALPNGFGLPAGMDSQKLVGKAHPTDLTVHSVLKRWMPRIVTRGRLDQVQHDD
jgi:hypothetical protein